MSIVNVCNYNCRWAEIYKEEAEKITKVLISRNNFKEIHHIGGTAVQGLSSRPIVEIVAMARKSLLTAISKVQFQQIGYKHIGKVGISGSHYVKYDGDKISAELFILTEEDDFIMNNHLLLKEYLESSDFVRLKYSALKRKLAREYPDDLEAYLAEKNDFVRDALAKAKEDADKPIPF